ncbi:MAG: TIGR03546 family protein [Desulfobacteraceae bacterium]|nr:MAG: TIGR03546 family protein [Desulfobacteraceae bacterium]
MLNLIAEFLKILNSETEPRQISLAVCFALIIGITPLYSLHNLIVLFLVFILRVNIATFLLAWPLIAGIGYIIDPVLHQIGMAALTEKSWEGLWTGLYNNPVFHLARFNNTIVMGGLIFSMVMFVPCFFLSNYLVKRYRETFLSWVEKTRLMKLLKASKLFQVYQTVSGGAS